MLLRNCVLVFAILTVSLFSGSDSSTSGLVVHEWGTFTSVAGLDGTALDWAPLGGKADLPGFVHHFREPSFKTGLRGTVRMETPVLYFYAPHETTVNVSVDFPDGLITEWYPSAKVRTFGTGAIYTPFANSGETSRIEWPTVLIAPGGQGRFPTASSRSHYFAARHTAAAALVVADEQEKFLFYRGVAKFQPSLNVRLVDNRVVVSGGRPGAVILFENRNGRMGYEVAKDAQSVIERPSFTADLAELKQTLEQSLMDAGLFADEAHAMLETWGDSWFEEGARIIYVLPRKAVDSILPLTVQPAPEKIERVFVGRVEIITPEMKDDVATAIRQENHAVLEKYGRFLEPIMNAIGNQ